MERHQIDEIKRAYPPGTRLQLIVDMVGEKDMPAGLMGSVTTVDDLGQLHMNWDNGRGLALVPGVDRFIRVPDEVKSQEQSNTDKFIEHINGHLLPFIDFSELQTSYDTDMVYAKDILNRLHAAMVECYCSEVLDDESGDEGFVLIPGVVRGINSEKMCLALLELDLSSSGEHWGTSYLCEYGVVPQSGEPTQTKGVPASASKEMNRLFVPYDYAYTATIPGDIHVDRNRLPAELKDVIKDFRNHNVDLLFDENEDEPEM